MVQFNGYVIDGVRFRLAIYILIAIVIVVLVSLVVTVLGFKLPDFIGAAVVGGLMTLEGMVVQSLIKNRDEIQAANVEVAKIEAAKCT